MPQDLVIGIDSSTSATKAIAWSRSGQAVAEGRVPIALANPAPGHFEQDPRDWWEAARQALARVVDEVGAARIAGIAVSNQRETFGLFDKAGDALRPGTIWLDERARSELSPFAARFGADRVHAITGKPLDVTPCLYRCFWFARHEPEIWAKRGMLSDVHGYLAFRLTGAWRTSTASADPMGLLDMASMDWSDPVIAEAGLDRDQLPMLARPGEVLGQVSAEAARATGLLEGTPLIAGGGDGQCAGTGTNVFEPGRAYVNLGTAVVSGAFGQGYVADRAFRTMSAVGDAGYIYETCLRTGTFLIDWLVRELFRADGRTESGLYQALEYEAQGIPIGADGLVLVPYWSGCMTPYWASEARGLIAGLSASHTRGHVYRAVLEGIALEQAMVTDQVAGAARPIEHYVAIGGGAASDLWCQILAEASGRMVHRLATVEASSLGAAMAAAKGVGWYTSIAAAARAMAGAPTASFQPEPAAFPRWAELRALYADLWPTVAAWNARLAVFAERGRAHG